MKNFCFASLFFAGRLQQVTFKMRLDSLNYVDDCNFEKNKISKGKETQDTYIVGVEKNYMEDILCKRVLFLVKCILD